MSAPGSPGRRRKHSDAERRRRLRRHLEAEGWAPEPIETVIADMRDRQAADRAAEQAQIDAWRRRHPRLPEPTIRLVIAELRRTQDRSSLTWHPPSGPATSRWPSSTSAEPANS